MNREKGGTVVDPRLEALARNREAHERRLQRSAAADGSTSSSLRKFEADGVTFSDAYHALFARSPWVRVGGVDARFSEGDLVVAFSQFGVVEEVRCLRGTARDRPAREAIPTIVAFIRYEDPRSCVLVTDNLQGVALGAHLPPPPLPLAAAEATGNGFRRGDDGGNAGAEAPRLRLDHAELIDVPPPARGAPSGVAEWSRHILRAAAATDRPPGGGE